MAQEIFFSQLSLGLESYIFTSIFSFLYRCVSNLDQDPQFCILEWIYK